MSMRERIEALIDHLIVYQEKEQVRLPVTIQALICEIKDEYRKQDAVASGHYAGMHRRRHRKIQ